jgi:hypothetical protein
MTQFKNVDLYLYMSRIVDHRLKKVYFKGLISSKQHKKKGGGRKLIISIK